MSTSILRTIRGQENTQQIHQLSPEDDIQDISKHARIVKEQIAIDGVGLYTAADMMKIDYDYFIDMTSPSYETGIYEVVGLVGEEALVEALYTRLCKYRR